MTSILLSDSYLCRQRGKPWSLKPRDVLRALPNAKYAVCKLLQMLLLRIVHLHIQLHLHSPEGHGATLGEKPFPQPGC